MFFCGGRSISDRSKWKEQESKWITIMFKRFVNTDLVQKNHVSAVMFKRKRERLVVVILP
jgi:hypothetical protein